jgi:rhomboid protease GluP
MHPEHALASTAISLSKPSAHALEPAELEPRFARIAAPTPEKARDWALVLSATRVAHSVGRTQASMTDDGFWVPGQLFLEVEAHDAPSAMTSIRRYEQENKNWPPRRTRERPLFAASPLLPLAFVLLGAFFLVTGPAAAGSGFFWRGTSVSSLVLGAEPWRAVTALTLHADSTHVLGNMLGGAVFAGAVTRRLGVGGGALAVVSAGALGNAANAAFYELVRGTHHASIGASTAVFAAVGLLAATALVSERREAPHERTVWTRLGPIAGGLGILGTLGASPRSDLGAHLFGFVAGLMVGTLGAMLVNARRHARPRWFVQPALGALAAGLVLGSWMLALRVA